MADITLIKGAGGILFPADQQSAECIAKLKLGDGIKVKFAKYNNAKFHAKIFALANLAYEAWEPSEVTYKGEVVAKNFDQFRDDLTILSGFYTTSVRLDGSVRINAKSWSFESMDDIEKEKLYNSIINVVLARILTKYTREDIDAVVESVLRFA